MKKKEEELDFSQIPYNFLWCINSQCPKAGTCLRRLAEECAPADIKHYSVLSLKHLADLKGECPYFCPDTKVRYARGFLGILENLTARQTRFLMARIINSSSRRTFYRVRSGERALSPLEQQSILNILKECGVTFPVEFDAYFEDYYWGASI